MRYRDQPTIEVTQRVRCDVATAWKYVTDITLPARCSTELQSVEWLDGADSVQVGARFRGRNHHSALGERETTSFVKRYELLRAFGWGHVAVLLHRARKQLEACMLRTGDRDIAV